MRAFCLALPLLAVLGGCSDPVPPTSQAAFLVNFQDNGADCPHMSHKGEAGVITASARTTVLVDGVNGASISCTVRGAGPFSVEATVIAATDGINLNVPSITSASKQATPAIGQVSFFSFVTGGDAFSSPGADPCIFYLEDGTPEGVMAGAAWMSFECPTVVESNSTCAIGKSFIILENCDQ